MIERYRTQILIGILLIAAFLRVGFLWRGDTTTDEVLYAFRAVGMVDFDEAVDQPTPLEWFDPNIPWWTSLSFHDHPPLVFYVQHVFMNLFGETRFAFRLPSALLGVGSVYLLYLIGTALYGVRSGLVAAALLAFTTNHLYISRIGLQESYVIFFALLALYMLLRARQARQFWLWFGVAVGLGLLTKYIAFVVVPIAACYVLLFDRKALKAWQLWAGAGIVVALFSPVLLYNMELYRAVGHFDFQFSYIFGQHPEVWKVTPGKEIGTLADRIRVFPERMLATHSVLFLLVLAGGLCAFAIQCVRSWRSALSRHAFVLLSLFFVLFLIAGIGPSFRFLTLLTPFVALFVAGVIALPSNAWAVGAFALLCALEAAYGWNSIVAYYPVGRPVVAYAEGARDELYNWGFNDLSDYLSSELDGKMPVASFDVKYSFLDRLQTEAAERYQRSKRVPYYAVIVYDGNIQSMAQIWILDRLNMYHAWPVVKFDHYIEYMRANAISDITKGGFEDYYFIVSNESMPMKKQGYQTDHARVFEDDLRRRGVEPVRILNHRGEEAFRVYKLKGS